MLFVISEMQSTPDISAMSSRLSLDTDVPYSDSDIVKKLRLSVSTAGSEGRNSCEQVDTSSSNDSSKDQVAPATPTDSCDRHYFHASLVGDKYLLLDQVDSSSLYRCVNVQTQQKLVCKVVTRDNTNLIAAHYRLDSEPHVSSLHEVLLGDRYLYLVFPRSHGDLHSYVRQRRRIREPEARRLFKQVAETVRACHKEGIVLRDLKLRKFVFADAQRTELKLESLEDAVILDEVENDWLHDKRGCPAYVSPEILRAGAHYSGKAADMWSLGVILYTMLVGRYPFNDSEHASLFAKISRGHFIIPDCLSSRARCLIRSLLRREPSERIASEDVLHHPWFSQGDRESHASLQASRQCDQLVPSMPSSCSWDDSDINDD